MNGRRASAAAALLVLAGLSGCGVKALPRPPLGPHPEQERPSPPAAGAAAAAPPQGCTDCAAPQGTPPAPDAPPAR